MKQILKQVFSMDVEKDLKSGLRFAKLLSENKRSGEFFISGHFVDENPKQCRKYFSKHTTGGHGFWHEDFSRMSYEKQEETVKKTKEAFENAGLKMAGWRFPGLNYKSDSLKILANMKIFDSSVRRRILEKWGNAIFIRNWLRNLKCGNLVMPKPFPKNLDERPWDFIDLGNPNILNLEGRLILHCFNYNKLENNLKSYFKSYFKGRNR